MIDNYKRQHGLSDFHRSGISCARLLDPQTKKLAEPEAFLCAWNDRNILRDWYVNSGVNVHVSPNAPLKHAVTGSEYAVVEVRE